MVDEELHVYPLTLGIENGYDCEEGIRAVKPESVIDLPSSRTVVDSSGNFRKHCLEVVNFDTTHDTLVVHALSTHYTLTIYTHHFHALRR